MGSGNHHYYDEGTYPRVPRKNASYAGVSSSFVQNDSHAGDSLVHRLSLMGRLDWNDQIFRVCIVDFRRMQHNTASFRHGHPIQGTRPNYRVSPYVVIC